MFRKKFNLFQISRGIAFSNFFLRGQLPPSSPFQLTAMLAMTVRPKDARFSFARMYRRCHRFVSSAGQLNNRSTGEYDRNATVLQSDLQRAPFIRVPCFRALYHLNVGRIATCPNVDLTRWNRPKSTASIITVRPNPRGLQSQRWLPTKRICLRAPPPK